MITEIELLKKDIPRLEKKFGINHVFVKILRARLALLQNRGVSFEKSEMEKSFSLTEFMLSVFHRILKKFEKLF